MSVGGPGSKLYESIIIFYFFKRVSSEFLSPGSRDSLIIHVIALNSRPFFMTVIVSN